MESLGERLKKYEVINENIIPSDKHIIVRIDGHKFSKFTKGFKKPFDEILSYAMEKTTIDLVEHFGAFTGYTQSDEISLFFPSYLDNRLKINKSIIRGNWKHIFGGRTQKIVSLISSFTTMKFNIHLSNGIELFTKSEREFYFNSFHETEDEKKFNEQLEVYFSKIGNAWFDARVFGVPDLEEVFNSFLWRVRDCEKNSKAVFAHTFCSHKELQHLNGKELIDFCLNKTGNDWNSIEDKYKYGIFIKKEIFDKIISNEEARKNNQKHLFSMSGQSKVKRSRIISFTEKLTFSDLNVLRITGKYINDFEN